MNIHFFLVRAPFNGMRGKRLMLDNDDWERVSVCLFFQIAIFFIIEVFQVDLKTCSIQWNEREEVQ